MALDWTTTLDVAVTEGYVNYIATGADPHAHGVGEISGSSFIPRSFRRRQRTIATKIPSITRDARPLSIGSEARSGCVARCDEQITDNDDVSLAFCSRSMNLSCAGGIWIRTPINLTNSWPIWLTGMKMRFYSRQGVQSECDLIS